MGKGAASRLRLTGDLRLRLFAGLFALGTVHHELEFVLEQAPVGPFTQYPGAPGPGRAVDRPAVGGRRRHAGFRDHVLRRQPGRDRAGHRGDVATAGALASRAQPHDARHFGSGAH
jgi:hypothetical protein